MTRPITLKKSFAKEHICGDEKLNIAMGAYQRNGNTVLAVNKFGTNLTVGTSYEDIWLQGGSWTKLAAATTLEVASSSAADDVESTGAQTLYIEGLDSTYAAINETIDMDGQTPVVTTNSYLFVNRAYIVTAGTGGTNAGDIYISDDADTWVAGVPQTQTLIQVKISTGQGQTQQALYTVPAGHTAYITNGYIVSGASKTCDFEMHVIDNVNGVNRIAFEGEITNTEFTKRYDPYAPVPEKYTITVDAKVDSGTAEVSAGFDLILIPD